MSQNIAVGGELRLSFTGRIAGWSADHRWFVLAGAAVLLVVALFLSSTPGGETKEVFGAGDSRHGQLLIEDRFEKTEPLAELILFSNPSVDVDDIAFRSVVDALVTELRDLEGVASVASSYDTGLAFMVSEDRHVLMVRLVFEPGDSDELLEFVAPVIESVSDANQAAGEDFEVELFGDTSANKAFDDVILKDFEKVTLTALVGGLIIMVLAFGSVVAAAIPLIMAMTAIFLTIGVTVLVSQVYALQEFYLQLVLLIGLAVGIDYSLFIVSRFREERAAGHPKLEAIRAGSSTTGRAVFYAGLTVMISLTGLALTGDELFIGMGIGAVIVVLFAVILSLTLLPAVLSLLGDRVNWLRIPGLGRPSSGGGIWGAIIGVVLARPAIFATVTAAALIAVSLPVLLLHIGQPPFTSDLLPSGFEFKRGMELLEENFTLAETSPLMVVVDPGKDGDVDIPEIQAAVATFMEAVERDDDFVPPFGIQVSPAGNLLVINVPVAGIADEDLAEAVVRKLRNDLGPNTLEGAAGIEVFAMLGGFALPGLAQELIKALIRRGPRRLTTISNSAHGRIGTLYETARLVEAGLVAKCITSFPTWPSETSAVASQHGEGRLEVETVPQGTLSERMRAAGSGIPAFWVRTGVGTLFETGKEKRVFNGQEYVLEHALHADFALIKAKRADTLGNLVYDMTQRNHAPTMAMAARVTIVEVDEVVEPGQLDPEAVVTPGIFVDRLVPVGGQREGGR